MKNLEPWGISRAAVKSIGVCDSLLVESTVIDAGPQASIFLCNEEEAQSARGCGRKYIALTKSLFHILYVPG